jgi:hypothetical protein
MSFPFTEAAFACSVKLKNGISSFLIRGVFTVVLMFAAVGLLFPLGKAESGAARYSETFYELADAPGSETMVSENAVSSSPDAAPERTQDGRAQLVMKALAAAYPGRIGEAEFRNGDWAVSVMGEWFYYAQGRLLPEALKDKALEYDPQPFYNYAPDLLPWKEMDSAEEERLRNSAQRRQENPPKRSQHFYDALWQAHNREEAYERVKTIHFLSHKVLVHYAVLEELALVEARIQRDAQTDAGVREWMRGIEILSGWNWRSIADTQSRSFHAYGTAIDILPASRRGLETYWLWTSRNNPQWWAVPYTKRLHPPDKVIKAFEAYGFIWGGKWLFYDTMHFEYRPEILLLNDLPLNHY